MPASSPFSRRSLLPLLILFVGCGESTAPAGIASINVSPSDFALEVGASQQLEATAVLNSSGTVTASGTFTWSVADPSIASVDQLGNVTALAPGETAVRAALGGKSGAAQLRVNARPLPALSVEITIPPLDLPFFECQSFQLSARTVPAQANQQFVWRSSNPEFASVDAAGLLTSHLEGVTEITALWVADTTRRASAPVSVWPPRGPAVWMSPPYRSGSQEYVRADSLHGEIDLVLSMVRRTPGEVQLLLDGTLIATDSFAGGVECPVFSQSVTLNVDSRAHANGPHTLLARVFKDGAIFATIEMTVRIAN